MLRLLAILAVLLAAANAQITFGIQYAQPSSMDILAVSVAGENSIVIALDEGALVPSRDCSESPVSRMQVKVNTVPMIITACGTSYISGYLDVRVAGPDAKIPTKPGPIEIFSPRYRYTTVSKFAFAFTNAGVAIGKLMSPYTFTTSIGSMDFMLSALGFADADLDDSLTVYIGGILCRDTAHERITRITHQITCSVPLTCPVNGLCYDPFARVDVSITAGRGAGAKSAVLSSGFLFLPPPTTTHVVPAVAPANRGFKFHVYVAGLPDVFPFELTALGMPHGAFFPQVTFNPELGMFVNLDARCSDCPTGSWPLAYVWRFEGVSHVVRLMGMNITFE
jgi:hypothetical protein